MYSDEYLKSMSELDALKLNRAERRRRNKLLNKDTNKIGISSIDKNNSDMITISRAELKRMVDTNIKEKIKSIDEHRNYMFKKITYEMFYIISYVMYKHYGFGAKRMNKFFSYLFEVYYSVYMDEEWKESFNESKFDSIRNEMRSAFDIKFIEHEYDNANKIIKQTELDENKIYDEVRNNGYGENK